MLIINPMFFYVTTRGQTELNGTKTRNTNCVTPNLIFNLVRSWFMLVTVYPVSFL